MMRNGEVCGGQLAETQVFVWETNKNIATQRKLISFFDYIIAPQAFIPPGDCVIIEFDALKETTQYVCEQYEIAEKRGDITIEWPDES